MVYRSGLFRMMSAATTPGTHPQMVKIKTITIDPHPLSITANGGKRILSKTRHKLINSRDKDTLINTDRTVIRRICYGTGLNFLYSAFSLLLSMIRTLLLLVLFCLPISGFGQFLFEGQVNASDWNGQAYLSEISDYRKLQGVFNEQLIQRVDIDSTGVFKFEGDDLPAGNRMYRIHVDRCASFEQEVNHFTGNCEHSKAMIIIANNRDTISLPQSFDEEIFCQAVSTNEATLALLKVDSLMDVMKYDFVGLRSETAIDNLLDEWFERLHKYTESQDPLVGLYAYALTTDRSTIFYDHYTRILSETDYYEKLGKRLWTNYLGADLTIQYYKEVYGELSMSEMEVPDYEQMWYLEIIAVAIVLLVIWGIFRYGRKRPGKVKHALTPQEERVLDLIKQNKTNKEIAAELFISHSTVKSHVNNIYRKLGVATREEIKSLKIK